MKKIITIAVLTALLILTVGHAALAETCEEQICDIVKQNERVTDAQCIIYQRACLVAIKTEKFTTKSDYDDYIKSVTEQIKNRFEVDQVFVTRSPRIMQQLNRLAKLDKTERDGIIKEMIERELNKHSQPDKEIMPRCFIW